MNPIQARTPTPLLPSSSPMHLNRAARGAGALYILLSITTPFGLLYAPHALIARGDSSLTATNILSHELLFRFAIAANLLTQIIFIGVAFALYALLSSVSKQSARIMVALVLVSAAIGFANEVHNLAALSLFRGGDFLIGFTQEQRNALGLIFLRLQADGCRVNQLLWGAWLFPFGLLVFKSGFLPRTLGVLLIINCFAYVAISLTPLLLPAASAAVSKAAVLPVVAGELSTVLWLLIKGISLPSPLGITVE